LDVVRHEIGEVVSSRDFAEISSYDFG